MNEVPGDIADTTNEIITKHNNDRGDELCAMIARALMAERIRCAKIARGDVYHKHYRTWPFWHEFPDGTRGNRSNESEIVGHADDIADAIMGRK